MDYSKRCDVPSSSMDHLHYVTYLVACAVCWNALAISAARDLRCNRRPLKDGTTATLSHRRCSLCRDLSS